MGNYMCLDATSLENLARKILVSLIERYENHYVNKGRKDDDFFALYPLLFDSPQKRRPAHFARKRILVLSDRPFDRVQIKEALKRIVSLHPEVRIRTDQIEAISGAGIKKIVPFLLKGTSEFSDIIAFVNGKKDAHVALQGLIDEIRVNRFLFPYLCELYNQKPEAGALAGALEKTLYVAARVNDSSKARFWKKYAFYDKLANLVKAQVMTANRTKSSLDAICNQYGIVLRGNDLLAAFADSRILVVGASNVAKADLVAIVREKGLDAKRFDFELDYKSPRFDFEKLRYSTRYAEVIAGPLPHSLKGSRGYSSGLALMADHPDIYPHLVLAMAGNELKITLDSFRKALGETYAFADLATPETQAPANGSL